MKTILRSCTLTIILAVSASCTGLEARRSEPVEITAPEDLATVGLPFSVTWRADSAKAAESFVVFVDASPMPPGERIDFLVRTDASCARDPTCPDADYLRRLNIFPTRSTSITLSTIPDARPPGRLTEPDIHEVAVVPLDGDGRRLGEEVASVRVIVERD